MNQSRFYALPGVPLYTNVVGGKSPYGTAPHDYRLPPRCGRRPCQHNCKDITTCNSTSERIGECLGKVPGGGRGRGVEPFPKRAELCQQNYQYYNTMEQMLTNRTRYNSYVEDRELRRGQRKSNVQRPPICPKGWYLDGKGFCRGPTGYSSLRKHARSG